VFTGIIQEVGTIVSAPAGRLVIGAGRTREGLEPGASVAVNGVCLTATALDEGTFTVDTVPETLRRSNLGQLRPGSRVNLERALTLEGELGGHLVQGHIDATGTVISRRPDGPAVLMKFSAPPEVMANVVEKGFIAVDGTSLTVVDRDAASFSVSIIPLTRTLTILLDKQPGDAVNLETDIIGKYVAAHLHAPGGGLTADFLRENGFPVP
jgi:riboflavin synthase